MVKYSDLVLNTRKDTADGGFSVEVHTLVDDL